MLTLQQFTFFQMAAALHDFITVGDLTSKMKKISFGQLRADIIQFL